MHRIVTANALPHEHSHLVVRWKQVIDIGAFVSLLGLIVLLAIPWRSTIFWSNFVLEGVVFGLGAIFALELIIKPQPFSKWISPALPVLTLALFAVMQSLPIRRVPAVSSISVDDHLTQLFAQRAAAIGLVLVLLLHYTTTLRRYIALVASVIGAGVLASLMVLGSTLIRGAEYQSYAQFQNKNAFAYLMDMAIGLGLAIILKAPLTWPFRLLGLVLITPPWIALVLTRSRGGLLALTSQLLLLIVLWTVLRRRDTRLNSVKPQYRQLQLKRSTISSLALIGCLVVAILSSVYWIGGNSLIQRLENAPVELSLDGRTGGNRLDIWRATWRMFVANPVFGTGLGAFGTAIPKYHDASGKWVPQQAHNDYLELLAGAGIVGGAIGVWFLFMVLRTVMTGLQSKDPFKAAATLGAVTGCFGVAVHSLFDFGLHIDVNALVFITLVAIATIGARASNSRSNVASQYST